MQAAINGLLNIWRVVLVNKKNFHGWHGQAIASPVPPQVYLPLFLSWPLVVGWVDKPSIIAD
jgi:hypothetical protein